VPLGRSHITVGALSAVAGFVDTVGYLALFGLFPSHVTGDLVSLGALVAVSDKATTWTRLAMVPVFMVAVAFSTLIARRSRAQGHDPMISQLALVTAGLLAFCISGALLGQRAHSADGLPALVLGAVAVSAMGFQNGLTRVVLAGMAPSTVMTGNLTQFTISLVEAVLLWRLPEGAVRADVRAGVRRNLLQAGAPLLGFVLGVVSGGYSARSYGLLSIALPALGTAALWLRCAARAPVRRT
jgi:uncharacterized membrane protein YoaK (UPF0700 family)